jgi:hypothetical protein
MFSFINTRYHISPLENIDFDTKPTNQKDKVIQPTSKKEQKISNSARIVTTLFSIIIVAMMIVSILQIGK